MPHLDDFIIGRLRARRRLGWQSALAVDRNPPIPRWKLELNREGRGPIPHLLLKFANSASSVS